ncbi:MAG: redoxin family protein [Polyangiales bacterium]
MTIPKVKLLVVVLASALASLALAAEGTAQLGKPAPAFKLRDTEGKEVSLASFKGKTVVLEWFNPDCPFAKHAHTKGPLADLAKRVGTSKLVWLTINSSAPGKQGHGQERNVAAKQEYAIANTVLLDEDGKVGRAYGAEKTPHLFVIDGKGVLRYRGGQDNAPMGVVDDQRPRIATSSAGTLDSYVEDALQDLQKKSALRLPETPAYGCSVKYAD